MFSMNANQHYTGQGESSSGSRPSRLSVSFPSCIYCGYNDHQSNDCLYYPTCEICGSYDHDTHGHNMIISLRRGINLRNPQHVTKNCETCGKNAESFKARKNESSSALRSKTPTKRYLKGTPSLGLWYPKCLGFDLKGYSDSDYVRFNMNKKSTSSTSAAGCCANILWMKSQLTDFDIIYEKVPIFCDNTSAIVISNNLVLHSRTKHIDIRYHFIRDHALKGDIELHFIPTQYQLTDIFTKPLDEPTFKRLIFELENSKVSFSIPTGGIFGELRVNTFRNAIGAHYLAYSGEYVALPSIDVDRQWFPTIRYEEEVSAKGTLKKSLLPPRKRASSIARHVEEEEASKIIKLEDLAKLVSNVQPNFKDLDSPEDDHVIIIESDAEEDDGIHATKNVETKDTLDPKSSSPKSSLIQELTNQVLILQYQKDKLEMEKNEAEAALLKA
ncbi:hypothetical protein Tco_0958630 [Tanacetum coccineum]